MLSIGDRVTPGCMRSQYTWLWLPWIQGPSFCPFFFTRAKILGSGDASFQRCPGKYCVAAPSRSCEPAWLSNRPPPLLIWAGGNSVHWPISISPLRCQAPPPPPPQQYPAPLSRLCLLSDILLFFFLLLILFALNHLLRDIFRLPKCRFSKTSCFLEFHQRLKNKYIKMNATVLHTFSSLKENLHYLHPRDVFQS